MKTSGEELRVVIADDHHLFRDGLRDLLEDDGMTVVGEATAGGEAVALVRSLAPDAVILDLNMPGGSGLDALLEIVDSAPDIQAVVLTVSDDDADVLAALAAGACGYLLKDTRTDRLAGSIRRAIEGHMVLSGEVTQALVAHVQVNANAGLADAQAALEIAEAQPGLTPREAQVLRLIAEGADNVAIGKELSISPHTVKQHVTNIFVKLGVHSRVQAAVYAVRSGLI
jgi:DNA-binding NarL/FixJ family response regulator